MERTNFNFDFSSWRQRAVWKWKPKALVFLARPGLDQGY
jgi:hypothetical protein